MTEWLRPIEQLVLASSRNHRVIGVTAPHSGAGVSTISNSVAEMSGRWGSPTLLVDLSQPVCDAGDGRSWAPGLGDPRMFLETTTRSCDILQAKPNSANLGAFNSARQLRDSLAHDLSEYSAVILDLRSILDFSDDAINPLVTSIACDAVIVVCAKGHTTADQLRQTTDAIRTAGASIIGMVLNDLGRAPLRVTSKQN